MAKITLRNGKDASLDRLTEKSARVARVRLRGEDGNWVTIRKVETTSPEVTKGLTYLFRKNVERAREENLQLTGSRTGKV